MLGFIKALPSYLQIQDDWVLFIVFSLLLWTFWLAPARRRKCGVERGQTFAGEVQRLREEARLERVAETRERGHMCPGVVLSASNSSFNWSHLKDQELHRLPVSKQRGAMAR